MSKNHYFNDEVFTKYMMDIKDYEPLTLDEERDYLIKIKNGDLVAKEAFFKRQLKFIVMVAKEYYNDFLDINDLINEGNIGMIKALEKYDFDVKTRFMSYAVFWVRQHIISCINKKSRTIRIPENILLDIKNNTNTKEVATCTSLILNDDDSYNISDTYIINDEPEDNSDILNNLNKIIKSLKKRDKQIIEMYFGLNGFEPLNLEDIGDELGLSKERVRQIKTNTLRKLKHLAKDLIRIKNI